MPPGGATKYIFCAHQRMTVYSQRDPDDHTADRIFAIDLLVINNRGIVM